MSSSQNTAAVQPLERIRPDVRAMHAYVVQDAGGMVKLDAMENPWPLPPHLQQALGERLGRAPLNLYPGVQPQRLRDALAKYAQMPQGWAMMLGNGSDELISLLTLACAQPGATVLAPQPGFVMYGASAHLHGLEFIGVPLRAEDFELDVPAMCEAIARHRPAITWLAYPNNPTGTLWKAGDVQGVIDAVAQHGGLVVMDEAYQPFASESWLERMRAEPQRHAHVLLMRTMSKFGLAGVRLGYLMGAAALVNEVDKVRPPYNVSVLNCECALFALEHTDEYARQAASVRSERERLQTQLHTLPGVRVWDSQGNMVLVRVPDAAGVFSRMRERGVLVKNVSTMHPMLANCLRLSVGTPGQNEQMLAALQESL